MKKFEIVDKEMVAPNMYMFEVYAPLISEKVQPGQFVIVIPDEEGERVPFTLADWDAKKGTITMFIQELGVSTMKMANMDIGDVLESIVGPLGKVEEIDNYGTVVVGGGCYGIGAIFSLVKALKGAGNKVITVLEARSNYLFYLVDRLAEVSDELVMASSDGSTGTSGKVHNVLRNLVEDGTKIDRAYFMGCNFMLMISSHLCKELDLPCRVSLNALMVDGTGMCGCCRCTVEGKTKFACVDGPWFDGNAVDWDELFQRSGHYVRDETMAYQFHTKKYCKQDKEG